MDEIMITKLFTALEVRMANKIDILVDHTNRIVSDLDNIFERLEELEKHEL